MTKEPVDGCVRRRADITSALHRDGRKVMRVKNGHTGSQLGEGARWGVLLIVLPALVLALAPGATSAQAQSLAQSDEDIVRQFYPERLTEESNADYYDGGPAPFEAYDFRAVDLEGTGIDDLIIAAYTNGFSGAVRVLRKQGGGASLIDEPDLPLLGGIFPYVEPLDLDGDGTLEMVVSLSSARGREADWLFKWNGRGLRLIGPSSVDEYGDVSTVLRGAAFVDINGDGVLEIINPPEEDPSAPFEVFDLEGHRLKPVNFVGTYVRSTGKPTESVESFPASSGRYLLRTMNGDSRGDRRVSSGVIRINGVVVVGPDRFSQNVAEIRVEVNLERSNELGVELRSAPESQITLVVEPL